MQLLLIDNLPFTTLTVTYRGKTTEIPHMLIDTGSGTTIFSADKLRDIDIVPLPEDTLYIIRGVGGSEVVFSRQVDSKVLEDCCINERGT